MAAVLVIDDELDVLAMLQEILAEQGHAVAVADDGRSGLDAARRYRPDLVICDIFLPEDDGLATIRELSQAHPKLPILAITGRASLYLKAAQAFGAAAGLAKPFGSGELQNAVDDLLHNRAAMRGRKNP